MDAEIRQRLIDAEGGLLLALSDERRLLPFHSTWAKLQEDIAGMKCQGELTEETLMLAHVVASRISMIAQCCLEMQQEQKLLMAELASGVEDILNGLDDVSITSVSQQSEERFVPFIETAYNWLLQNIHNPYPSTQFKASVAKTCSCSQNSVNTWFINARRRIGWTSLCREQFHNCRADALDAAYRALVRPDPARPLPAIIIQAFETVKANTEGLYSSTVAWSANTKGLDASADVTEYGKQKSTDEDNARQGTCRTKGNAHTRHESWCSETPTYPSPFSSPPPPAFAIPTLIPSLSDESDDEDQDVAPPVLAGRKRRASLSEDQCTTRTERQKRLRVRSPLTPSTSASEPLSPSSDDGTTTQPSIGTQVNCVLPRSRKRRLSEGAEYNLPKRPRGSSVEPRLQVVSDPLPRTTSNEGDIEDWFQTNFQTLFDLPPPVECLDPDPCMQWEFLFGGYSIPSASLQSQPHLMHSPPRSSEVVLHDVEERGGDCSGFDDLFLPLENEACEDALSGIQSSALQPFPEHQFALSDGTPSVGGVSFLDDWVTLCESTPQTEGVGTYAPEPSFEFPDLLVSQPSVNIQLGHAALILGDIGLPVGA
ncbi:C-terminal domain of homeodomain 1-domain-containing protein [Pisolithus orientalis]|uniref:C-terminal domain of homeodomain 1-domain-containing protein n=1 Tax=Pisolithus orientalis TaxID=936130 RepID=UPI0022250EC7|nr:C-terminal domain of homeodomain 1-domain-containing protein [Pisolithus orientalis]KAI5981793.1 C-terminal domain of homeodomain 1-domain-containing protein [Pisolithus orientalis]